MIVYQVVDGVLDEQSGGKSSLGSGRFDVVLKEPCDGAGKWYRKRVTVGWNIALEKGMEAILKKGLYFGHWFVPVDVWGNAGKETVGLRLPVYFIEQFGDGQF